MLLRKITERVLPVREGEQHLSPRAADMVFRGRYSGLSLDEVQERPNKNPQSMDNFPYTHVITRVSPRGIKSFANSPFGQGLRSSTPSQSPLTAGVEELNSPEGKARVQRVERTASRIKAVAGAIAGLAVAATLATAFLYSPEGRPAPALPACEDVLDGSETLLPVPSRPTNNDQLEQCHMGGHPYFIVETPER